MKINQFERSQSSGTASTAKYWPERKMGRLPGQQRSDCWWLAEVSLGNDSVACYFFRRISRLRWESSAQRQHDVPTATSSSNREGLQRTTSCVQEVCSNRKIVDNSISLFSRKAICGLSKDDIWEIITAISRQLVYFIITRGKRCIFNECRIISE